MPSLLLERLPLPSFRVYAAFSVAILAVALMYTHHTIVTAQDTSVPASSKVEDNQHQTAAHLDAVNFSLPYDQYKLNFLYVFSTETWCVWTIVNMAYCVLILLGKLIQAIVFGELRVSEQQHLKDKFWNFVFYKFIFIFGVMNVQTMEEVILWVAWFTCLGFLHLLTQLSKDRFEYLSFSPTTPRKAHAKLLGLLALLLISTVGLLGVCVSVGLRFGLTIFAFMAAECVLLGLKTLYVVIRYMIHLWDLNMEGVWENRSVYIYYTELIFELFSLFVDFFHHLHMLLWGNIFLSMASLVICMQLRYLFYEFQRRVKRHKNYLRVVKNMQARFPMASQEDLEQNADDCAICWERMDSARKLPCGHLFHNACLRSWLEQDTSCPTCRLALSERPETQNPAANRDAPPNPNMADAGPNVPQGTINHFFHFDASRYVSWLPSFSVEVTHTNILPGQQLRVQTSQLDNMLRQVQAVFPNYPQSAILEDLRQTRSVDITIDNILEGRIVPATSMASLTSLRDDNFNGVNATASVETSLPPTASWTALPTSLLQPMPPQQLLPPNAVSISRQLGQVAQEASQQTETEQTEQPTSSIITTGDATGGNAHNQGGRFSKSSSERMAMLQERKNFMLEQARRRYLSHHSEVAGGTGTDYLPSSGEGSFPSSLPTSDSNSMDEERVRRRELMLQATQRRLNGSSS